MVVLLELLNPIPTETVNWASIVVAALSTAASLGVGYLAFRSRKINPTENGIQFVSHEAQSLATFHRDDALAARTELAAVREQLTAAHNEISRLRSLHR